MSLAGAGARERESVGPSSSRRVAALVLSIALASCGQEGPKGSSASEETYVAPADAAACEPGDPREERHGTNCLCCHTGDFTIAGSVDRLGAPVARIVVIDSVGAHAEMAPDPYGNFFRHNPLVPPLRAIAYGPDGGAREMAMPAPHTACNECHRRGAVAPPIVGP